MTLSVNLKSIGKYLDQPALVKKFYKAAPIALFGAAIAYDIYDTSKAHKKDRKNKFIQNTSVLGLTALSALLATRGLKIRNKNIFEGLIELPETQTKEILDALAKIKDEKIKNYLIKLKDEKLLGLSEISELREGLDKEFKGEKLLDKMLSNP